MVSQWSEELRTKSVAISGHGDAKFSVGLGAGAGRDGLEFFSLDLGKDLLLNSAEKQASPASTAFAPPPWAVSKGFAHPTQTQLVLLDLAVA